MFKKIAIVFIGLVLYTNNGFAQNSKSFQKKMNFWLGWYHIPGGQIAFIKDGKVSKTFNFRSTIYRGERKVKTETLFQVGKVNQIYTALALMKEISDRKIKGSKDVNEQISTYKLRNSILNKDKKTTPYQLLNHSGGINRPNFNFLESDLDLTTLELLKGSKITQKKKIHNFQTPLKSYLYSEGAFTIARLLVEESAGLSYQEYLDKNILPVLGVEYYPNGFEISEGKKAQAHDYSKWALDMPNKYPNPEGFGSWMSAKDYANLLVNVLEDNQISEKIGIKSKVYDQFTIPSIKIKDTDYSSCAVFEKHDFEKGIFRLVHNKDGYRSWAYYDTESKEGIVILLNSEVDYFFSKKEGKVLEKIKKFAKKYGYLNTLSPYLEN